MKKCIFYNKTKNIYICLDSESRCFKDNGEITDELIDSSNFINVVTDWYLNKEFYNVKYYSIIFDDYKIVKQFGTKGNTHFIYYDDEDDSLIYKIRNLWLVETTYSKNIQILDNEL